MAALNRVILIGNLAQDPVAVETTKTNVTKMRLAINRPKKDKADFVDITAFGKSAELIAKHLSKGRLILVEGHLEVDEWEKDGKKMSKLVIILDNFEFLDSKKSTSGLVSYAQSENETIESFDEEIPVSSFDDLNF